MHLRSFLRHYGSTLFVITGLVIISLTVVQVQLEQRLPTRAAGEDAARAQGVWFDPNPVSIRSDESVEVRLKLDSLSQLMTDARLVFNYDPQLIQVVTVGQGVVFPDTEINSLPGKLILVGKGEFLGTGTWVKLQVRLLRQPADQPATLTSDPQLSELQYQNHPSTPVNRFDLTLQAPTPAL